MNSGIFCKKSDIKPAIICQKSEISQLHRQGYNRLNPSYLTDLQEFDAGGMAEGYLLIRPDACLHLADVGFLQQEHT